MLSPFQIFVGTVVLQGIVHASNDDWGLPVIRIRQPGESTQSSRDGSVLFAIHAYNVPQHLWSSGGVSICTDMLYTGPSADPVHWLKCYTADSGVDASKWVEASARHHAKLELYTSFSLLGTWSIHAHLVFAPAPPIHPSEMVSTPLALSELLLGSSSPSSSTTASPSSDDKHVAGLSFSSDSVSINVVEPVSDDIDQSSDSRSNAHSPSSPSSSSAASHVSSIQTSVLAPDHWLVRHVISSLEVADAMHEKDRGNCKGSAGQVKNIVRSTATGNVISDVNTDEEEEERKVGTTWKQQPFAMALSTPDILEAELTPELEARLRSFAVTKVHGMVAVHTRRFVNVMAGGLAKARAEAQAEADQAAGNEAGRSRRRRTRGDKLEKGRSADGSGGSDDGRGEGLEDEEEEEEEARSWCNFFEVRSLCSSFHTMLSVTTSSFYFCLGNKLYAQKGWSLLWSVTLCGNPRQPSFGGKTVDPFLTPSSLRPFPDCPVFILSIMPPFILVLDPPMILLLSHLHRHL
jgi:hypothetical protein